MKAFLLSGIFSFALAFSFIAGQEALLKHADIPYELEPNYTIVSDQVDSLLNDTEAVFQFRLNFPATSESQRLIYSINAKVDTLVLMPEGSLTLPVQPGTYAFQFYIGDEYYEIITGNIEIKPQHRLEILLNFRSAREMYMVKKPVIYIYPDVEMDIDVQVKPAGKMLFTYPQTRDQWKVHAQPSGDLTVDEQAYNYLFWESEQKDVDVDWNFGFAVEATQVVEFLERSLSDFGMTSKEQADFITYWAPQMLKHPACAVHFIVNEDCNRFAELQITPAPEHIYRLYMIWKAIGNINDYNYFCTQKIQPINRLGYTVLEWGGVELTPSKENRAL